MTNLLFAVYFVVLNKGNETAEANIHRSYDSSEAEIPMITNKSTLSQQSKDERSLNFSTH